MVTERTNDSLYDYEVLDLYSGCAFCDQFDRGLPSPIVSAALGDGFRREIFDDPNFAVVATLGQLVRGWLLIIPRRHITSISALPDELHSSFLQLLRSVRDTVGEFYSSPAIFEHGTVIQGSSGAACIEHAHLHVLPSVTGLYEDLAEKFVLLPVEGLPGLWSNPPSDDYLYYETSEGESYLVQAGPRVPCQFFRRYVADLVGQPERWDWRSYLGTKEVAEVTTILRGRK